MPLEKTPAEAGISAFFQTQYMVRKSRMLFGRFFTIRCTGSDLAFFSLVAMLVILTLLVLLFLLTLLARLAIAVRVGLLGLLSRLSVLALLAIVV
ncbi:MAG: hypothetical protein ACXIUM_00430 [Wenzhouxiangella sp.]